MNQYLLIGYDMNQYLLIGCDSSHVIVIAQYSKNSEESLNFLKVGNISSLAALNLVSLKIFLHGFLFLATIHHLLIPSFLRLSDSHPSINLNFSHHLLHIPFGLVCFHSGQLIFIH